MFVKVIVFNFNSDNEPKFYAKFVLSVLRDFSVFKVYIFRVGIFSIYTFFVKLNKIKFLSI